MTFAALLAEPGVRVSSVHRSRVGFLAFHGGLERGTEEIAERAADLAGASCLVVVQPPGLRWHIPSVMVGPGDCPALAAFLDHVTSVVAIHGYGRPGRPHDILLGGRDRTLAFRLAAHLTALWPLRPVTDLDDIPAGLRGLHPDNPVNLAGRAGVQVELPPLARDLAPGGARLSDGGPGHAEAVARCLAAGVTG